LPIFLTPSGAPLSVLAPELRKRLHCLVLNIIDEDLAVTTAYTVYQAQNRQWVDFPTPRIRKIDMDGVETLLLPTTDYTLSLASGTVTLVVAATADDTIRGDYSFDVFTDAELTDLLAQSAREVNVLLHRKLDTSSIHEDYKEVILKRAFTNAFKCLMEPTFNFFSVSVAGRAIDKTMLVDAIKKIMDENEEIFMREINALRNFNQTDRFE